MTPNHPLEGPLEGTVKWFDSAKGYGFIVPHQDGPDIMLHANALRSANLQSDLVPDGTTIITEVEEGPQGGWRASKVLSLDTSTATHTPARTHVTVTPTGEFESAQVKWYNGLRGYGFLSRGAGTEDIFVHAETLKANDMPDLSPGESVMVRFGPGPKGLMAVELQPV